MKILIIPALLIASVAFGVTSASAQLVRFEFNNLDPFDGGNDGDVPGSGAPGAVDTRSSDDESESASMTLVDVFAPEYAETEEGSDIFEATGEILSGPDSGLLANIRTGGNLGVNHPLGNSDFESAGGPSGEVSNFNTGEGIVIEFERDVIVSEIDFASIDAVNGESFDVNIEGVAETFNFGEEGTRDIFVDPFGGMVITAGTDITFTGTGPLETTSVRIDAITVQVDTSLTFALGDFDLDGDVDLDDLDQYNGQIGNPALGELAPLDFDGNDVVDAADFEMHYTDLVETSNGQTGTFAGDINLDGTVNVLGDALILVTNLGMEGINSWGQGDLNADQAVNVLGDALLLVTNLGSSNVE